MLSESARELIWEKVMLKGEPMKSVSAELGVDIRRIGAVVRLKEVEKDWISNVSIYLVFLQYFCHPPASRMMIPNKNSISLEDKHPWLHI